MRSAPSVTYPVGRSVLLMRLLLVVGVLCMAASVLAFSFGLGWWALAGGLAWVVWVMTVTRAWQRQPQGRLAWEPSTVRAVDPALRTVAGHWSWFSAAYLGGVVLQRVERVHDLQAWMLLRLHNPDGARTWVWVERGSDPDRWDDLRRALWLHG
jgi:hypothetical protein